MTDILNEIRQEVNYQLDNFNVDEINKLVNIINETKNNIYFIGIGKSGNIAKHCCDLLKSVSIKCFYLDPNNLLHGDIGVINNNLIIMFSKSGNTKELLKLIPYFKNRKCFLVGICCDNNSLFEKNCDLLIRTPFIKELDGEINNIPTNSIMSHLLFSNILVSKIKENIKIDNYKENHLAGNIGKNLRKIKDCLVYNYPKIILDKDKQELILLHDVFLEMTKYKIGCCFFVNKDDNLLGLLTDGDLRRLLIEDENKKYIKIIDINTNYYYETNLNKYVKNCKKTYIPIINNQNNKILGIIYDN